MSDGAWGAGGPTPQPDQPFDLARFAFDQAMAMNQQFAAGMRAGKQISNLACQALKVAYESALADPTVKMPTPLHCAVENILRLHEQRQINDSANAAIKRDKEVPQWEREARTGAADIPVGR